MAKKRSGVYYVCEYFPKGFITNSRYIGLIHFGRTFAVCENFCMIRCKSDEYAVKMAKETYCDKVEKRTYNENGRLIKTEILFNK